MGMIINSNCDIKKIKSKMLAKYAVKTKQIPLCKNNKDKPEEKKSTKQKIEQKKQYSQKFLRDLRILKAQAFSDVYGVSVWRVAKLKKEHRLQKGWMWEADSLKENLLTMSPEDIAKLYRVPFVGAKALIELNKKAISNEVE